MNAKRIWDSFLGFGTTAADRIGKALADESGQSVIEFLLMLPALIGLAVVLVRVNTVIQISIVNQQYARAHALWLAFNSPIYPERRFRTEDFEKLGYNRMIMGVSENSADSESGSAKYLPVASTFLITRNRTRSPNGSEEVQKEPDQRGNIRVRTTVALCTQSNVMSVGKGFPPVETALKGELGSSSAFAYCRSPQE